MPVTFNEFALTAPVVFSTPFTVVSLSEVVPAVTVKPFPTVAAPVDSRVCPLIIPLAVILLAVVLPVTFNEFALTAPVVLSTPFTVVSLSEVVPAVTVNPFPTVAAPVDSKVCPLIVPVAVTVLKFGLSVVSIFVSPFIAVTVIFFPAMTSA
ncbi:hypothetical protein PX668_07650 [Acinetobacter soli]|nr:hypothetical protein [Acinetobacter soli]WEI12561.1 hypothetical protein PX667_14835 [Acinetobacter soli]WEI16563.1 hypothetical protein PX668_07650 [Acinetobacter soli]